MIEPLEHRILAAAQTYNWRNATINGTGFINGVVYSPVEKDLVYAYTDMGGAYRWDKVSSIWRPLNDWSKWNDWPAQNLGAEALAVDPTDANRVYMVAGTYNSPAAFLRSSDKGNTWARTEMSFGGSPTLRVNGNGNGRNGGDRLVVDPNLPTTLFYGSRLDGLWKSTDRAVTWARVNTFPVTGDTTGVTNSVGIIWLVVDKTSGATNSASQRIYAGVSTTGATKIYRSDDGGRTWAAVGNQPSAATAIPIRAALTPDGNNLYLTYANNPGPNDATAGTVYKVSNPAATSPTWTALPLPVLSSGGWSGIAIDPSNTNRLLVSTLDRWGARDDLYRSTDAGATWRALGIQTNLDNTSAPYANAVGPHWLGDVDIDPYDPNVATFTTGNGLYRTAELTKIDAAVSPKWSFFNKGIEQSAVLELVSPPSGSVNLISAIGDRDGFRHVDLNVSPTAGSLGQSQNRRMSTSTGMAVAWSDSNYMVRSGSASPNAQFSVDGGVNWSWFSTAPTGTTGGGDIQISADGTRAAWDPAGGAVVYATRSGSTWSAWQTPAWPTTAPADVTLAADLVAAQTFYAMAGTSLYRSTDGGANWTLQTASAPTSGRWLRAVQNNTGHLLLSTGSSGNGLWRSTNAGTNWTRINSSQVTTAIAVGVGAPAPSQTYPAIYVNGTVGGKTGFFRSDDQGANWTEISDAAHQFGYITVVQGDPRIFGRIYVGANGRGVLYGDLDITPPTVSSSLFGYLTGGNSLSFSFSEDVSASLDSNDLVVTLAGGATVSPTLQSYNLATNTATFTLPAGIADGNYTALLTAAGVKDNAGIAMTSNNSSTFYTLVGDANRDRTVDTRDFNILMANFGLPSRNYAQGDFSYDATIDSADFALLVSKFGVSVAAPGPLPLASSAPPPTFSRVAIRTRDDGPGDILL